MIDFGCKGGRVHSCAFCTILRSTGCDVVGLNTEVGGYKPRYGVQPLCTPLTLTIDFIKGFRAVFYKSIAHAKV